MGGWDSSGSLGEARGRSGERLAGVWGVGFCAFWALPGVWPFSLLLKKKFYKEIHLHVRAGKGAKSGENLPRKLVPDLPQTFPKLLPAVQMLEGGRSFTPNFAPTFPRVIAHGILGLLGKERGRRMPLPLTYLPQSATSSSPLPRSQDPSPN